ncbi:MAG: hypothetical protein AAB621_03525 [Patescibacteria group bacterium]
MEPESIIRKKWLIISIVIVVFIGFSFWLFSNYKQTEVLPPQQPQQREQNSTTTPTDVSSISPVQATSTVGTKTYRNTEYGFEFQYPMDWKIIENPYGSPFSKFNLIVVPTKVKYLPDPILVNIVVPDFADNAFRDLRGIDVMAVNRPGKKYEYREEGLSQISIVLTLGENKVILGANKEYEDIFNQILATFKFLNNSQ